MIYSSAVKLGVKKLFVIDGMSATAISDKYKGKPTVQTICNWSDRVGNDGRNWPGNGERA